jgi:predicted metalloprotease with PDZ domain
VRLRAYCNGRKVAIKKLDKQTWQAAVCKGELVIEYEVYAWDLSVRAAHLDQSHAFFNGTSVFLQVAGQADLPHVVDIQAPMQTVDAGYANSDQTTKSWRVATSLPRLKAKPYGFGTYIAANYDELIDHPVEIGNFALVSFQAHQVQHDFVLTGQVPNVDLDRIAADLKKICETEIAFFEPRSKRAPMERYVFMTMAVGEGMGGLEHRASTALVCSRNDLPTKNQTGTSDAYINFLILCSHEYFHTWNVKRIKPAVFANYDLTRENYTSLLWLFEGFTSYYEDVFLVRAGLISEQHYFKLTSKNINAVLRGSGRSKQSVAESSFDAWIKYYRQDENAPNAIVSYYAKGAMVGLALDLSLRAQTDGKKSLDDVMRALWQLYGRDFYQNQDKGTAQGVAENEMEALIEKVTGVNVKRFMDRYVRGTEDLPLAELYADFGVQVTDENQRVKPSLDVRLAKQGSDCKLANVYESGAAHRAGLSAGDVLVAINGLRVTAADVADNLAACLSPYTLGETVQVYAFRRDELLIFNVKLQSDSAPTLSLCLATPSKTIHQASLLRPTFQKKQRS